ncbi:hypothetical protein [Candidatus Amarolinea dominans]|uniref:hypothetical protein n=1 Tax=Candidatus Amarolinea dominans TaxID=3140696 RepID=UPI0031370A50|nr:hypothetical protein [Anaerolineae bacterium]
MTNVSPVGAGRAPAAAHCTGCSGKMGSFERRPKAPRASDGCVTVTSSGSMVPVSISSQAQGKLAQDGVQVLGKNPVPTSEGEEINPDKVTARAVC